MAKIILCEINISDGRNPDVLGKVESALRGSAGARVIDIDSEPNHNRSVYTFIGDPASVLQAAKNITDKAIEMIDMTTHRGSHPRMGAVDVVPFVPIRDVSQEEALEIARAYGKYLGAKGVPVYYYEDAATRPERKLLVDIRKGQYEALPEKMKDELWRPDEGPFSFNARSGATVAGVRFPLIAYNVNLRTDDMKVGAEIAKRIRFSSGGLRFVRAIALPIEERGLVQISMNLTNYEKTPIPVVYATVSAIAETFGVAIADAELVGPVPLQALQDVVRYCLRVRSFDVGQIVESHLLD
ncbi:MAG: glutamate formimidoyltransferase [Synergistaceae bacterium]|nr:glutamate formimidoyltransferase [Synergistaceae bacterium]